MVPTCLFGFVFVMKKFLHIFFCIGTMSVLLYLGSTQTGKTGIFDGQVRIDLLKSVGETRESSAMF